MAFASLNITAIAVEATEFPDLARRYQVSGVPKTIVTAGEDQTEILGALPQDAYIAQALESFTAKSSATMDTGSHGGH
jgi:predicted DsbA family dithiol-disulfide isomerase